MAVEFSHQEFSGEIPDCPAAVLGLNLCLTHKSSGLGLDAETKGKLPTFPPPLEIQLFLSFRNVEILLYSERYKCYQLRL